MKIAKKLDNFSIIKRDNTSIHKITLHHQQRWQQSCGGTKKRNLMSLLVKYLSFLASNFLDSLYSWIKSKQNNFYALRLKPPICGCCLLCSVLRYLEKKYSVPAPERRVAFQVSCIIYEISKFYLSANSCTSFCHSR